MIEIFKTNVSNKRMANGMLKILHVNLPACVFNFDLDDCDRILRAQGVKCNEEVARIIQLLKDQNIEICLFED